jgi:hypothetical protein
MNIYLRLELIMKKMNLTFLLTLLIILLIGGCVTTGGPPMSGLKYLDRYPNGMPHAGIDLDVPYGAPVRAITDGEVGSVIQAPNEIYLTLIHRDKFSSLYYHLGKVVVKDRETVKQGQIIAYTGQTGFSSPARNQIITYPHLHLEIWQDGNRINPEKLKMTCPSAQSAWWWPVGCEDSYKSK